MLGSVKTVLASAFALVSLVNADAAVLDVKRNDDPAPSCSNFTPFKYAGCFNDPSTPSALNYRATQLSNSNMTVETCVSFCKGNSYRYAGLEYYGECFCGSYVNGMQIDESNCNYPCSGNASEACGGTDIISVYQDPTFPTVDDTTIMDYKPMGCYSDQNNGHRALAWQQDQLSTSNLTVEECLFTCKQEGYAYAGVEFAYQCFCGVVIGNGSVPIDSSNCNMACSGNSSETCGGAGTLNLYGAADLQSSEPCGYVPPPVSSSSSTPTPTPSPISSSSSTPTPVSSSSATPTPSSSSTPTPTPTTISTPTPSSCTVYTTSTPSPVCEYQCGNWCANPLASFSDASSCSTAASNCAIQLSSCFLQAGWPASWNCFKYATWCSQVSSYCSNYCPGKSCSPSGCKSKYPPSNPQSPSPSVSTSVGPCSTTISTTTSSTPTVVPVPSPSCICKQPNTPSKGYSSTSPVGNIAMPCMTCNNVKWDWNAGNWFKVYNNSDTTQCKSYPSKSVPMGCQSACDNQKTSCMNTYAQNCKSNTQQQINQGADSYSSASTKCQNQWNDCYIANKQASGGNLCSSWNSGWH